MAITKAQTTRWSARVKVEAMENSIALTLSNQEYQTEAVGAKTIKIIGVNAPTIRTYDPATGLPASIDKLTDTETDLDIDQYREFQYQVQDINIAQSTPDYVPAGLIQAGNDLALEADKYFFGSNTYSNASIPADNKFGTLAVPIALTSTNIEEYLSKMATALRRQHVARGNMWCAMPPEAMRLLNEAGGIRLTDNVTEWSTGVIYEFAGMKIVESTEVVQDATADGWQILAFSPRAIPMAASIQKIESLMNPADFGEIVRGLYAFGVEVLYPKELSVLSATIA